MPRIGSLFGHKRIMYRFLILYGQSNVNSLLDKMGTKMGRLGYFTSVVIISTMVACLSEVTLASCTSKGRQFHTNILFVTSNNQFCFPQFYLSILVCLSKWKRKKTLFIRQNSFFFSFGPMKCLLSFSTAKMRTHVWKNWGWQNWWFDVTNKI